MRKQAYIRELEDKIKKLQQELDDYKSIANWGHWQLNFTTGDFNCSPEIYKVFGIENDKGKSSFEKKLSVIHPDDKNIVKKEIEKIFRSKAHGEVEYRIISKGNAIKYIREWIFTVSDVIGNPIQVSGVVTDISEQKFSEQALNKSQAQLDAIFQHAPLPMVLLDEKQKIIQINKTGQKKSGKKIKDIKGKYLGDILNCTEHFKTDSEKKCDSCELKKMLDESFKPDKERNDAEIQIEILNSKEIEKNIYRVFTNKIKVNDATQLLVTLMDITKRRETEKALLTSENQFRSLLNNTTDGVVVNDNKGRIIYGNPSLVKMLGYNNIDEVIDLSVSDFINPTDFRLFNIKLLKKGSVKNYETELIRKDGKKLYILISSKVIFLNELKDYIIESFVKDITDLKDAEIKVIKNNQHLERLLKLANLKVKSSKELIDFALKEGLELTNSELGFIDLYNPKTKMLTIHAWSKSAMGRSKLFKKQLQLKVEEASIWEEIIQSKRPFIINNISEENIWGRVINNIRLNVDRYLSVPVELDNEIVAITSMINKKTNYDEIDAQQLTLLMDTVWKRLEKQKADEELIKAKEKAIESDQLKSSFLANMSHEIRTPLNVIVGFANLLSEGGMSQEEMEYQVKIINQGANQLSQIINDIIDISKIETGQVTVKYSDVDIKQLITKTINLFLSEIEDKNLTTELDIEKANLVIHTDELKIKQILGNLIANAIKFTQKGKISIAAYKEENDLILKVADTGIGIPLFKQGKIFDRFQTGEVDLKRKHSGTGLGLPISKGLIELLNGKIWVDSKPGKGSIFYVSVPINRPTKTLAKNKYHKSQGLFNKTILIAEDETFNFYYLEMLLKDAEIIHAPNGQIAVELVKETPSIDLVLMDIKMPVMNGFDAAKLIKEINPGIPIIAQSAFATSSEINRAKELGFEDYITKPINSKHLLHTIYETFARKSVQVEKENS